MFNGIVECTGTIEQISEMNDIKTLSIRPQHELSDLMVNDSLSVNGVCLTLIQRNEYLIFNVVPETLRVTNLDKLTKGSLVNLERSLKMDSRISGHYVQGHVDCVGEIISFESEGDAILAKITIPRAMNKYIVNKGYVAVDGMSLTVIHCDDDNFSVTLIPHTQEITLAKNYLPKTLVNIETDILGRYIEKILGARVA